MRKKARFQILGLALIYTLLTGCTGIGPATVARDRFDYTTAVAESWKRSMLLNIVKIRYGDAPIFLDVVSITNQYVLATNANALFGWSFPPSGNSQSAGVSGSFIDRPTITYTPLTGEKFARNLMTPVAPVTVMSMVEGGYPIDFVFRILVSSVNGKQNQFGGSARMRKADPEFYDILEKLRRIQMSGAVALRVKKGAGGGGELTMIFRKKVTPEMEKEGKEVRRMLGLKEEGGEFRIVYGSASSSDEEIALLTRSIIEVLSDVSSTVEVPAEHVVEKRAPAAMPEGDGVKGPLIRILCSRERPANDFTAVPYRDRWFWIDDRDYGSKRLFSFLMFVMTLTETGGSKEGAPIVTISAGS
jgi:hypothetical protein